MTRYGGGYDAIDVWTHAPLIRVLRLFGAAAGNAGTDETKTDGPSKDDIAKIQMLETMKAAADARTAGE